jgi:hypothetical protein
MTDITNHYGLAMSMFKTMRKVEPCEQSRDKQERERKEQEKKDKDFEKRFGNVKIKNFKPSKPTKNKVDIIA